MNRVFKSFFCLSIVSLLSVQAEEYKLCILVDGSQKMVTEKSYDAVLSALDAKILDAQKQKIIEDDWSVEIVAVGVTKQLLSSRRFQALWHCIHRLLVLAWILKRKTTESQMSQTTPLLIMRNCWHHFVSLSLTRLPSILVLL